MIRSRIIYSNIILKAGFLMSLPRALSSQIFNISSEITPLLWQHISNIQLPLWWGFFFSYIKLVLPLIELLLVASCCVTIHPYEEWLSIFSINYFLIVRSHLFVGQTNPTTSTYGWVLPYFTRLGGPPWWCLSWTGLTKVKPMEYIDNVDDKMMKS